MVESLKDRIHKLNIWQNETLRFLENEWLKTGGVKIDECLTSKIDPMLLRNALYSQRYGMDQHAIHKRLSVLPERIVAAQRLMDYTNKSLFFYDELVWQGKEALKQYEEREKLRERLTAHMRRAKPELPKLAYYKGDGKRIPMPHLEVSFANVWAMKVAAVQSYTPRKK